MSFQSSIVPFIIVYQVVVFCNEVPLMKKECERTRQALPSYLRGHLFKINKLRIERHLEHCVVCRSEFEAIRRTEETRQILKDINAPDSVVGRVREVVSSVRNFKKILYRPLWMAGLLLIAGAVYYYAITPRQLDLEIERIVKTEPSVTAPLTSASSMTTNLTATIRGSGQSLLRRTSAPPARERLIVTITADDEAAVQKINEIMHENNELRKMKFSDSVREIGGSLISRELLTFFSRINSVAKISYNRRRFESFPATELVPFVMKLAYTSRRHEDPGSTAQQVHKSAEVPSGQTAPAMPMTAPPHEPVEVRSEAAVPAPPKTAPSQSALP